MSTDGSQLGFGELLRLAGSKGLQELDVQLAQVPDEGNAGHAVVVASARTSGALYRAVGEAWRDELPSAHRFHVLTVAERRAKIRVLCEAVGMPQPTIAGIEMSAEQAAPESQSSPAPAPRSVVDARPAPQRDLPGLRSGSLREPAATLTVPADGAHARTSPPAHATEVAAQRVATAGAAEGDRQGFGVQQRAAAPRPGTAAPATERPQPEAGTEQKRPGAQQIAPEPLGPDIFQQLMRMMHQKGALDGEEITDEEAHARLDSFFQRAFNHPLEEGTRVEGKQTIQRLASVISRLKQERAEGPAAAAS